MQHWESEIEPMRKSQKECKELFGEMKCPSCGIGMCVRIKKQYHSNVFKRLVSNQKYYQIYCWDCDDENTGWTTTKSDELSTKLK